MKICKDSEIFKNSNQNICVTKHVDIEHACTLLATTSLTVDEIILAVGYTNKNQFYKIFKSQVRKTPAKYRMEKTLSQK